MNKLIYTVLSIILSVQYLWAQRPTHIDIIDDKEVKPSLWESQQGLIISLGIVIMAIAFYVIAKRIEKRKKG